MRVIEELIKLLENFEIVDLTPTLERGIPRYPSHPHTIIDPTIVHEHDGYYCQTLSIAEHTGAHVDAPAHTCADKMDHTIERVPLERFMAPAVVYPIYKLGRGAGEAVSAQEILQLEAEMQDGVRAGEVAILRFDWDRYWHTDHRAWYYAYNCPGLTEDAVKLFMERGVSAVATDTMGGDQPMKDGQGPRSYGHKNYWLPNDIYIIEELVNLSKLPTRCYFFAVPLKIKNGSGSPVRAFAWAPKAQKMPSSLEE